MTQSLGGTSCILFSAFPDSQAEWKPEVYSEHYQKSKMERFAKIVNGFKPLTILEKRFILDDWQGSKCVFENQQL